jgi:hypothetical protein
VTKKIKVASSNQGPIYDFKNIFAKKSAQKIGVFFTKNKAEL